MKLRQSSGRLIMLVTMFQAAAALGAEEIPPPPYLVSRSNHVMVGVVFDEAVVKSMLPAGIRPAAAGAGGIHLYQVEEASGIPLYSSYYMWVDIEGYDAPDGTKARWMLAGRYSPPQVSAALAKYYGYPVREGASRIEWAGERVRAGGILAGSEVVLVELLRKKEPCQRVTGKVNEVTRISGKDQVITFPFAGDWCAADPAQVVVNEAAGEPFVKLKPLKLLWAGELRAASWPWVPPVAGR